MTERTKVADKFFLLADGSKVKNATADAVSLLFTFHDGEDVQIDKAEISPEMAGCFFWHGASQKYGDEMSASKREAEKLGQPQHEVARDAIIALHEAIKEDKWIQRAASAGPRVTLFAAALCRALLEAGKTEFADGTEINVDTCAEKAKELGTEKRKAMIGKDGDPKLRAAYDAIQAERAAERAEQSGAVAESAESTIDDM